MSPDGLLIVDKARGISSHGVVAAVRRLANTRKVGHAGTLDPMATGVLVVGLGRATRLLGHLAATTKSYDATIRLGVETVTDDAEGDVLATPGAQAVTDDQLRAEVLNLTGQLWQRPSRVSAIKVDGKRAYALVRAGEEVELAAREVTVSRFDVVAIRRVHEAGLDLVDVDVTVDCSTGTYIRALARDLGVAVGTAGHLTALRRTRVGGFTLDLAHTLDQLADEFCVISLEDAAAQSFPRRELSSADATNIVHGIALPATGSPGPVAAFAPSGEFVALLADSGAQARSLAVFVGPDWKSEPL